MKIIQAAVLSAAALTLVAGALPATPALAKTMHHGRYMRHHRTTRCHRVMHRHVVMHRSAMTKGATNKGTMDGSAAVPTTGVANPAMSMALATNGDDKIEAHF